MARSVLTLLSIALIAVSADASGAQIGEVPSEETVAVDEPATLVVWNRPIIEFRARIGNFTPRRRVQVSSERIEAIPHTELTGPVHVQQAQVGDLSGYLVLLGARLLFAIVEKDSDPTSGQTLES